MFDITKFENILAKKAFEYYYLKPEKPIVIYNYLRNLININNGHDDLLKSCYEKYIILYNKNRTQKKLVLANPFSKEFEVHKRSGDDTVRTIMLAKKYPKNKFRAQLPGEDFLLEKNILKLP